MVSPDPIVEEPLVAYSDKGHLDINDDFVKDQIIYPLEYYIETISSAPATRISVDPWHGIGGTTTKVVEWMSPELIISLDQDAPWNKVVAEVHNGKDYVTGCVPVAMALIMTRCKSTFMLRGKHYNFAEITKCIAINQGVPGLGTTTYSYNTAVNEMAQLLSDIGQEVNAEYVLTDTKRHTSAYSDDAFNKMKSWGFVSPFSSLKYGYNADILKTYLKEGNIVYVSGISHTSEGSKGHSWVADGYQVLRRESESAILLYTSMTYVHFNWGWGGRCDGYFSGNIYTPYTGCDYSAENKEYAAFKLP